MTSVTAAVPVMLRGRAPLLKVRSPLLLWLCGGTRGKVGGERKFLLLANQHDHFLYEPLCRVVVVTPTEEDAVC